MSRITYQQLIKYAAGELGSAEATEVGAWIAQNPPAAATVARYRMASFAVREDDGTEPPSQAAVRARALFSRPGRPTLAEHVAALVARLVFDSRVQPTLAGLRGRASGFQLTYDLAGHEASDQVAELDLHAEPAMPAFAGAGRRWRVVGQVAGPDDIESVEVYLCRGGSRTPLQTVRADRYGTFMLNVEPGTYDLYLHMPGRVAVVFELSMA